MNQPFSRTASALRSVAPGSDNDDIYGKLGSVSLQDLLQMLSMTQRTATVNLDHQGLRGQILLKKGLMLHAETPSLNGEDALINLVRWDGADFVVSEGIEEPESPSISRAVDAVMLSVASRIDESSRENNVTPFPIPDPESFETLDKRIRASTRIATSSRPMLKPPIPSRPNRLHQFGIAASALAGVLVVASVWVFWQMGGLAADELPHIERVSSSSPSGPMRAASALLSFERALELSAPMEAAAVIAAPEEPSLGPVADGIGQLLVLVQPWGEVAIDGRSVGTTPLTEIELSAGRHLVNISNPEFIGRIEREVEVAPGETARLETSFRSRGRLRVLVRPWADVSIDGQSVGQTPMNELEVTPGKHSLILKHPELGEQTREIVINEGETTVLEVEM